MTNFFRDGNFEIGDGADAHYAVCVPYFIGHKLLLPDNRVGSCCQCNSVVQYRPTIPPHLKGKLVCSTCASRDPDFRKQTMIVSPNTMRDIKDYLNRNR